MAYLQDSEKSAARRAKIERLFQENGSEPVTQDVAGAGKTMWKRWLTKPDYDALTAAGMLKLSGGGSGKARIDDKLTHLTKLVERGRYTVPTPDDDDWEYEVKQWGLERLRYASCLTQYTAVNVAMGKLEEALVKALGIPVAKKATFGGSTFHVVPDIRITVDATDPDTLEWDVSFDAIDTGGDDDDDE